MISYRKADLLDQYEDHGSVRLLFKVKKSNTNTDRFAYYLEYVFMDTEYTSDSTEAFKDKIMRALNEARFKPLPQFGGDYLLLIPTTDEMEQNESKINEWAHGFINGMGNLLRNRFGFRVSIGRVDNRISVTVTAQ